MLSLWTEIRILEEDDNAPSVISISYIGCNNFADQDIGAVLTKELYANVKVMPRDKDAPCAAVYDLIMETV